MYRNMFNIKVIFQVPLILRATSVVKTHSTCRNLHSCANRFEFTTRNPMKLALSVYFESHKLNLINLRNEFQAVRHIKTSSILAKKKKKLAKTSIAIPVSNETEEDYMADDVEKLLEDQSFKNVLATAGPLLTLDHNSMLSSNVMVLQPWIKWGPNMRHNTSSELMLEEACALICTLPDYHIRHQEVISVLTKGKSSVFGSGTIERLIGEIRSKRVNTVFISVDILRKGQVSELQETLGVRILDRYQVVLGIFHHRARSVEARLQVALAELPYIRKHISGERENLLFDQRESKIKKSLERVAGQRQMVRRARAKNSLSSVAIVGYTNCGKTTLINALTGDERAKGHNQLFATLDVTAHRGYLPCGLPVVFIDTVGFIQDIPTSLVASFKTTLQDAIDADVIIHARDASHPDAVSQTETVFQTLKSLPLPENKPVITVSNKIDLCQNEMNQDEECKEERFISKNEQEDNYFKISAKTRQGLLTLMHMVEEELLKVTGRKAFKIRLLVGSDEVRWLRNAVGVCSEEVDELDVQYTFILVFMNAQEIAAFKKEFKKPR